MKTILSLSMLAAMLAVSMPAGVAKADDHDGARRCRMVKECHWDDGRRRCHWERR